MDTARFEKLALELAAQDPGLAAALADAWHAAEHLRELAHRAVEAFKLSARAAGADYLAELWVGPVEADEKRVDCAQFRVARGRWELVCVAKAAGKLTLVGPFRKGKEERPCFDHPLRGESVEQALAERLEKLIRAASER